MSSDVPPVSANPPPLDQLIGSLRPILRRGLPVTPDVADDTLLSLRGVWARSIDPDQRLYRVKGLDGLLREMLKSFPNDDVLAAAAPVLFGVAPGSRGTTLTARRARAANTIGYNEEHVRKEIEPKIVKQLAWMIHQDSQTFTPRARGVPPPLAVSGDTPQITPEDLQSEDRMLHEEALSHLWALVYELRACLVSVQRLKHYPPDEGAEQQLELARETSRMVHATLAKLIDDYIEAYGDRIVHGDAEFDARRLARLAGWK